MASPFWNAYSRIIPRCSTQEAALGVSGLSISDGLVSGGWSCDWVRFLAGPHRCFRSLGVLSWRPVSHYPVLAGSGESPCQGWRLPVVCLRWADTARERDVSGNEPDR